MSTTRKPPGNTILVMHDPLLDVRPFLHRLIGFKSNANEDNQQSSKEDKEEDDNLIWTIDNKYYTATVDFRICTFDNIKDEGIEVVIYLFTGIPPDPLPPSLVRVITKEPRDIALAIRISPPPKSLELDVQEDGIDGQADHAGSKGFGLRGWDAVEEAFDELGMEVVDEDGEAEDDDERPISPLETVRQTLMTHMWPNMVRKPLGTRIALFDDEDDKDDEDFNDGGESASNGSISHTPEEEGDGDGNGKSTFPISFDSHHNQDSESHGPDGTEVVQFPEVAELRAQLVAAAIPRNDDEILEKQDKADFAESSTSSRWADLPGMKDLSLLDRLANLEGLDSFSGIGELGGLAGFEEDDEDAAFWADMGHDGRLGEGSGGYAVLDGGDVDGEGDGSRPGDEEYAKLEEWLENNDDGGESRSIPPNGFGLLNGRAITSGQQEDSIPPGKDLPAQNNDKLPPLPENATRNKSFNQEGGETNGMTTQQAGEDDFFEDDFTGYQSAPPPNQPSRSTRPLREAPPQIPLDPTPLLLHLQSVRAEITGIEDPEERRLRAGREVEMIMRGMGIEGIGLDDLDDL